MAKSESKERKVVDVAPEEEVANEQSLALIDDGDEGEDTISPEAVSARREKAEQCVKRLRDFRDQATELFIEVAQDIYFVSKENLFVFVDNPLTNKPYDSFKDFVEGEVDYGVRKAHYLVNLWEHYVINEGKGSVDFLNEVRHLGSSKLILLIDWITQDNKKEWIDIAEKNSCRQLEKYTKKLLEDQTPGKPTPEELKTEQATVLKVQLFDDQLNVFNEAARILKEENKLESKGEILAAMASDFISHNSSNSGPGEGLKSYLSWFENHIRRRFNDDLRITAFDKAVIVYGNENIDAALEAMADDAEEEEF